MKTKLLIVLIALTFVYPIFGQSSSTKRVAILETVDKENRITYSVKLMIRSKLTDAITNTPGYEGYDRVDISSILDEHEFLRTGLVSDSQIKRLGEMTGADYILIAEVAYLNSSLVFISSKILNVETAHIERTANIETQYTVDELGRNCKVLAGKLLNINTETGAVKGELIINGKRYVGEHKNGKPHGRGVIFYNDDKLKSYEGDWYYGKREGNGTLIWKNGSRYVGEWKNDHREGYGVQYDSDGEIYEGNWLNGKKHGKGKITFASNDSSDRKYYDGDWVNGVRQGTGTMVWNDGEKYIGGWKNGKRNGKGVDYYANGNRFDGMFMDDKRHGQGTYYRKDGSQWDGDYEVAKYQNGIKNGPYTYYFNDGDKMVGTYKDGEEDGSGTYYFKDGRYQKEYWVAGKRHGTFYQYRSNGSLLRTYKYKNGKLKKSRYHRQ